MEVEIHAKVKAKSDTLIDDISEIHLIEPNRSIRLNGTAYKNDFQSHFQYDDHRKLENPKSVYDSKQSDKKPDLDVVKNLLCKYNSKEKPLPEYDSKPFSEYIKKKFA